MDALLDSPIKFVTTHHEQGAAFMADVYGRLTGRAGVCMSTLGPGRDQPDHRRGRRQHGPRAGRRHRRPGRDDAAAQGEPPDPRPGEHVRSRSPSTRRRSSSPRSCRRSCARRSRSRRPRSPAPPSSTSPRTSPRCRSTRQPIKVQTAYTSEAPDAQDRRRRRKLITRRQGAGDPGRQRRDPPGRGRRAGERSPRCCASRWPTPSWPRA